MSLAPIPKGSFASAVLTLLPGAQIKLNEFGTDVLTADYIATYANCISLAPAKYAAVDLPGFSLSAFRITDRKISRDEGLTGKVSIEAKGFLSGSAPDPIRSLSTDTRDGSFAAGSVIIEWPIPVPTYTINFCVTSDPGIGLVGTFGTPTDAPTVGSFDIEVTVAGGAVYTLTFIEHPLHWFCVKDDWNQALPNLYERTQTWKMYFLYSSYTVA